MLEDEKFRDDDLALSFTLSLSSPPLAVIDEWCGPCRT